MSNTIKLSVSTVEYENFVCYFEHYYGNELNGHRVHEVKINFLMQIKRIALEHKELYERRHGKGSYNANFGKYGSWQLTPLQIINTEFNRTCLLMPKIAHNYITSFGRSFASLRSSWHNNSF